MDSTTAPTTSVAAEAVARAPTFGAKVYSFMFWLVMCAVCIAFFFVALAIWAVTLPFDRQKKVLHLWSSFWAHFIFEINPGWRLRIEGREKLPWTGPAVIVANHQSLGDILILFTLYRPYKWVSKASVFKVPFLGWNMALNEYVGLVRGNKESIRKMVADCNKWLDRKVPVLLFPEGTRSEDGDIKDFKDGAFRIAKEKGVPLIPIVLTGSADTLPKHGWVLTLTSKCLVKVLDPVDPNAFADVDAFRDAVRQRMIEEKKVLDARRVVEL